MPHGVGWLVRRVRSAAAMAGLVAVLCLVVSFGAGSALAAGQRANAVQVLDRRSMLIADAVAAETGRYVDAIRTFAAAAGAFEPLTAAKFVQTALPLEQMRLAGATSVSFLVAATDDQVAATQAVWRSRGTPNLVLNPVGNGREHILTIFAQAMDGKTTIPTGVDATQVPAPTQAMDEARRSGQVTVSDAYQLLIDRNLPAALRQMSFSLTAPVYGAPDAGGRREFRGWVLMALRGQDFIGAILTHEAQNLVDVTLSAQNTGDQQVTVATLRSTLSGRRDLHRAVDVTVANRTWHLQVHANGRRLPGGSTALPAVVTAAGTALGLLLAGLVYVLATGRDRANARVSAATAELAAAEASSRRQADLLEAIMTSISDGVGVVDEHGEFLLHNPAAKAMVGLDEDRGGAEHWQAHYGLFLPDGQTPFPTEQLPLVLALAGEATDQVEMVIRNPGQPDGITITVSGRPLQGRAGHGGAVAVFHDVTDRKAAEARLAATIAELREREADLHGFAGVAAHDLKAPLASMAAYAEVLDDELADGAAPTEVRPHLDRIRAGVERMRRLIDDLLAYATARDAQLRTEPVDLQSLVGDVITERTAHLRAGQDGAPFPDIYTGPLPVVHADPAMIRQLFDNLIGNALKYTLPGQPARIDISAAVGPEGWAHITIADRGVGIPVEEQPHVFTSFHRAAGHSRYQGTGLGLAICQRVVERHGGTIGLTDNPGGGTRIRFTLPTGPVSPARGDAELPVRPPVTGDLRLYDPAPATRPGSPSSRPGRGG